jgi:MFS family permease
MDDVRDSERWAALAGPAFLVLMLLVLALQGNNAAEDASGAAVVAHYTDGHGPKLISAFLAAPVVAALLLFTGRLRMSLPRESGIGRKLLQYGAVLYAGGLLFGAVLQLALVFSADHGQKSVAETMNVLANDSWLLPVAGVAVMLLGAGMAVLRSGALPRWMGWVALVVGVVSLLGPGGFLGFFLGPIWIAAAGVMLYRRNDAPVAVTV